MRNFESSMWFANPNLKDVSALSTNDDLNRFDMTVVQVTPSADSKEGGAN